MRHILGCRLSTNASSTMLCGEGRVDLAVATGFALMSHSEIEIKLYCIQLP